LIHCENVRSRGVAAIGDAKGQRQQGVVERFSVWIMQKKTQRPVQFELTEQTRDVETWVARIGLDPAAYGTHSLRRTKATLIYREPEISGQFNFCSGIRNQLSLTESDWTTGSDGKEPAAPIR
jgi:hypothetical protein